jgi:hypothetical protein
VSATVFVPVGTVDADRIARRLHPVLSAIDEEAFHECDRKHEHIVRRCVLHDVGLP